MNKKRVTIPLKENDNLVLAALHSLRNSLKMLNFDKNEEVQHAIFDLSGLMGIFSGEFKVTIEIDQYKMDSFVSMFGVDFPQFADMEIVDVEPKLIVVAEQEIDEDVDFEHLAYIEDGDLVVAIRSNKPFEDSTCEDDTDMPHYRYQNVEQGVSLIVEGTPYVVAADSTRMSWTILKDGEVVEEVSE